MILLDYQCTACDAVHESLETRPAPSSRACPRCGGDAGRIFSPVALGTVYGYAATRGPNDAPPPGAIDTRPLAEGMSRAEWKKLRRRGRRDEVREGMVDRKVYV